MRHCAGTWIEQIAGKAVAKTFLCHATTDVTDTYTKSSPEEVANAVIRLWSGSHPLARVKTGS
jgi:hypothetical protein